MVDRISSVQICSSADVQPHVIVDEDGTGASVEGGVGAGVEGVGAGVEGVGAVVIATGAAVPGSMHWPPWQIPLK